MRILLYSHWFSPSIGGVEMISRILAESFVQQGHDVTVVTNTPGDAMATPYGVVRRPSLSQVYALARRCDVALQNTISLRTLPALLAARCPVVVTHQSWLRRGDGTRGAENYAKLAALRLCTNVAISRAIADSLPVPSTIIGNPFEASAFAGLRDTPRDRDSVFMGRLIADKGCHLLLEALGALQQRGLRPTLTVIGDGPQMPELRAQAERLGLAAQVAFLGALQQGRGAELARHRIMVVPSVWQEPFGIVALEGIAVGCAMLVSQGGGLPDATGACGLYFPNGDVAALAAQLERMLNDDALCRELVAHGPAHVAAFEPQAVATRYLDLFHSLLNR